MGQGMSVFLPVDPNLLDMEAKEHGQRKLFTMHSVGNLANTSPMMAHWLLVLQ